MKLSSFLSLLHEESLWFARLDKLNDVYEGAASDLDIKFENSSLFASISNIPPKERDALLEKLRNFRRSERSNIFVSCWYADFYESAAMWKLYGANEECICIKSTYKKLISLLPNYAYIGCIDYVDYKLSPIIYKEKVNLLSTFMHKRLSFSHEKEVRCLIWRSGNNIPDNVRAWDDGGYIKVSLVDLIEGIYISPDADPWFKKAISHTVERLGFSFSFEDSDLARRPLH